MKRLINRIYEKLCEGERNVVYGVYNEGSGVCIGIMNNRESVIGLLGGKQVFRDVVKINVYSDDYLIGFDSTNLIVEELSENGLLLVENIESQYDRETKKYVITFACSEKLEEI